MLTIWLVGRTNVWKSSIFNRLVGSHRAIVTDIAGTTRELIREERDGVVFIDSPGLATFDEERPFLEEVIEQSDLLLFVVDSKASYWQHDDVIKWMIIDSAKKEKTLLVVNKLDGKVYSEERHMILAEWYSQWFEELVWVSAEQVQWLEQIRDWIQEQQKLLWLKASSFQDRYKKHDIDHRRSLESKDTKFESSNTPICIIWRPNVGKSTLLNTLVGEWVSHVSPVAGTTLDYLSSKFDFQGNTYTIYDTAGIRKRWKMHGLERIAYSKTTTLLDHIRPVIVLLIDLEEWLTKRDASLIWEVEMKWLPMVLVCNKIDNMTKEESQLALGTILRRHEFLKFIPHVLISAQDAINLPEMMRQLKKVYINRSCRITTWKLNDALTKARLTNPPHFPKNNICKWKYITQIETAPPVFMLSVNNKEYANFSFKRWVENALRKQFSLLGSPVKLVFSSKADTNPYVSHGK